MASKPLLMSDQQLQMEEALPPKKQKRTVTYVFLHPIESARAAPRIAAAIAASTVGAILLIVLLSVYLTPDPTTRAFKKAHIIPDMLGGVGIDKHVHMSVDYPANEVAIGHELTTDDTMTQPDVHISGSGMFTLLMADPDATSPDHPIVSEVLHWMVTNIPDGNLEMGTEVQNYTGPAPPTGLHRYVIMLLRQPDNKPIDVIPYYSRLLFSTRNFIRGYHLQGPIQATYFTARPDSERN